VLQNGFREVYCQSKSAFFCGYYDGGTDYFNAKYNLWQIDLSGRLEDRISWKGYRSGHMMYLRNEDLENANEHIREFIKLSTPKEGEPAKYSRKIRG
jgi:carboxypeptidase C (cathepsin A)